MGIQRSTFYYQKKENIAKEQQEIFLRDKIQDIAYHYPYYGYRRITAQLKRVNMTVNHKRVLRIMRQLGIRATMKRRYTKTTNSKHSHRIFSNLIKNRITTGVWCSDITYICILTGFVYLAVIIDIYSWRIVGYALGRTLLPELTLVALKMALAMWNPSLKP